MDTKEKAVIVAALIGGICTCTAAVIGFLSPITGKLLDRFMGVASPTVIPVVVSTETPAVTFILVNNYRDEDFFVDGKFATAIDAGEYLVFHVPRGNRRLSDCPRGKNPNDHAKECTTKQVDIAEDPFNWEIGGEATPTANVSFILINNSRTDVDFFVDDRLERSVDSGQYVVFVLARGKHKLQSCPRNLNPNDQNDMCADSEEADIQTASYLWRLVD